MIQLKWGMSQFRQLKWENDRTRLGLLAVECWKRIETKMKRYGQMCLLVQKKCLYSRSLLGIVIN